MTAKKSKPARSESSGHPILTGAEEYVYTAQQASEASGLGNVLTQQYAERGLLRPRSIGAGGRTYRRFSYTDVLQAAVFSVLRNVGIGPGTVAADVRIAVDSWTENKKYMRHPSERPFLAFAEESIIGPFSKDDPIGEVASRPFMPSTFSLSAFVIVDMAVVEARVRFRLSQKQGKEDTLIERVEVAQEPTQARRPALHGTKVNRSAS